MVFRALLRAHVFFCYIITGCSRLIIAEYALFSFCQPPLRYILRYAAVLHCHRDDWFDTAAMPLAMVFAVIFSPRHAASPGLRRVFRPSARLICLRFRCYRAFSPFYFSIRRFHFIVSPLDSLFAWRGQLYARVMVLYRQIFYGAIIFAVARAMR